jgi:hypothetical protein
VMKIFDEQPTTGQGSIPSPLRLKRTLKQKALTFH